MYSTSTQKKEWTFTAEQIVEKRKVANEKFRMKYANVITPTELSMLMSVEEELAMQRIVEEAALRFADDFTPHMWPSVKWTAFAFFKRLFLIWSTGEASPKFTLIACFYLAMKIDEFYVTIDEFVSNLKSGNRQQNAERILKLEPEIMRVLDYNLTVHCPYRPFEGHLMEMKTKMLLLNFDLESIRGDAMQFFQKCLQTDVLLMYPPSQIALAAIYYGLNAQGKSVDILKDFLNKFLGIQETESWAANSDVSVDHLVKLMNRVQIISDCVENGVLNLPLEYRNSVQERSSALTNMSSEWDRRRRDKWQADGGIGKMPGEAEEQAVDSDDD